ncbi:hypothetical protein ACFU8W_31390 [Streptomyces sp. NPDC057565]|uniref:hypothetical protein n=1 Tax=Streptomyces sp. NPDC057565 TaxID=3346169 RepID=UPI0036893463
MPKKRNSSQRIGSIGEDRFRIFCHENFLIPNRVENDFGFDFLCQLDLTASFSQTGQISGTILGFSVRSTDRVDGRIKLTRSDAECLLAADFPVGLALVKLDQVRSAEVYFRFLDPDFIVSLSEFLSSTKQSKHFTPKDLLPASEITETVRRVSAPGYVEQSRVQAAERLAEPIAGNVRIQIQRDGQNEVTLVTSLDLYSFFEQGTESERDALFLATFGAPRFRGKRIRDLALKGGLMRGIARLPQPYVLRGFVMDDPTVAKVNGPRGSASLSVLRTANDHHYGYVHAAGFALTVSHRIKRNGQYVHEMRTLVDPKSDSPLEEHPALLHFLNSCYPDSTFTFDGEGLTLDTPNFSGIGDCANFASALLGARTLTGWQDVRVTVSDMAIEESRKSMMWLAAAAAPGSHVLPRGLVIRDVQESECDARNAVIYVPVVCNLATTSVVTWFSGKGSVLYHQDEPCGFKVNVYETREVEVVKRLPKKSIFPEVPLGPALLIFRGDAVETVQGHPSGWGDIHCRWEWD